MMFKRSIALSFSCGLLAAGAAFAGPLDPPGGPITSTFKTLVEVEPRIAINATNTPGSSFAKFIIQSPGSYYLTGNVQVTTNGHVGIFVNSSDVTIDLNGFTLSGGGIGDDAIATGFFNADDLTVRNGVIRDWTKEAVDAFPSRNVRLENLTVADCVNGYGLIVGTGSTIANCNVRGAVIGIVSTRGCIVRDCIAVGNGSGFQIGEGNSVLNCSASGSTAGPGFTVFGGSTLLNCSSFDNRGATGYGFELSNGTAATSCTAHSNDQDGIRAIAGATNVSINGCNASSNRGNGINVANGIGHRITGNTASRNNVHGIILGTGCLVQNNTCENNGTVVSANTHAISVIGSYNRIDGNNVLGSFIGISVNAGLINNTAIRNTATLCNTHYSFPAGVSYGAINTLPSGSFTDSNSFANLRF